MPKNFGGGVVQGMDYVQQRHDALDAQAQEMAIRNAHQRLQQQQFDYTQERDIVEDRQVAERMKVADQKSAYDEANDLMKLLYGSGVEGPEIGQNVGNYLRQRGIDPNSKYLESLNALPRNPQIVEKEKQVWATLRQKMSAAQQKSFDSWVKYIVDNGLGSIDQANQYAFGQVLGEGGTQPSNMTNPGEPQTQPQQPAPMNMVPNDINPFLQQLLGTEGQAQGQQPLTPKLLPGVGGQKSPKAVAKIDYLKSVGEAAKTNAQRAKERLAFDKTMAPLRIAEAKSVLAKRAITMRHEEETIKRMKEMLPYDKMMKDAGIQRLRQQNEIAGWAQAQKVKYSDWLKRRGYSTAEAYSVQSKAKESLTELITKRTNLQKEQIEAEEMKDKYMAILTQGEPAKELGIPAMMAYKQAQLAVDGLRFQTNRIKNDIKTLDKEEKKLKDFINFDVREVDEKGEERPKITTSQGQNRRNVPAVTPPPRRGASGLRPVVPPPGARKRTTRKTKSGVTYEVIE